MSVLDSLLQVPGSPELELRIPELDEFHPLVLEPAARTAAQLGETLPLVVLAFVAKADGRPVALPEADAIAARADVMKRLFQRLATLLEQLRFEGSVSVRCPTCSKWSEELGVLALGLSVDQPSFPVLDGPFFALPSLSLPLARPERPFVPCTKELRFELPSARLGLASPLSRGSLRRLTEGDLDADEELAEEADAVLSGDFDRTGPGYRALTRLARAIAPESSIEELAAMPVVDFFFLDYVHYLTQRASVREDPPGVIRCDACMAPYLPVL